MSLAERWDAFVVWLNDYTPWVWVWHNLFGHGETHDGVCWCCGSIDRL